jgi:outer membrane biogenesis lipoprotein LolB
MKRIFSAAFTIMILASLVLSACATATVTAVPQAQPTTRKHPHQLR